MENVLDIYQEDESEEFPLICMDETSKQQIEETRIPINGNNGVKYYDYEYKRNGVSSIFIFYAPLINWRVIKVTDRRTAKDWAIAMKELADIYFPNAKKIKVVLDNLNTHKLSSFYKVFEPKEAKRLADKFELHYTPKHASWLNMAEIEFSILSRQCLNRRIATQEILKSEVNKWQDNRNNSKHKINWRFTTSNARIKLKKLYPSLKES